MRRTILLLSAGLLVVVPLGAVAVDANVARGQTEVHVVTIAAEAHWRLIDHRDNGMGPGDEWVVWEPLFSEDQTERVGRAYWDFLFMGKASQMQQYLGTLVLRFDAGQITLQGIETGEDVITYAVTGGTGAYVDAQGDATLTNPDGTTDWRDIVVHLS